MCSGEAPRRQRDEGRRQRRDLEGVDDRQDDVVGIDRPRAQPDQDHDAEQLVLDRQEEAPVGDRQPPQHARGEIAQEHPTQPAFCRVRLRLAAVVGQHRRPAQGGDQQHGADPRRQLAVGHDAVQGIGAETGGDDRARQGEGEAAAQHGHLHRPDARAVGKRSGQGFGSWIHERGRREPVRIPDATPFGKIGKGNGDGHGGCRAGDARKNLAIANQRVNNPDTAPASRRTCVQPSAPATGGQIRMPYR